MSDESEQSFFEREGDDYISDEEGSQTEDDVFARLKMSRADFIEAFKRTVVSGEIKQWLKSDDEALQVSREVATDVFSFFGVKTTRQKGGAKDDPIYTQITVDQLVEAYRQNPRWKHVDPHLAWIKTLTIKGEFSENQFRSAAGHVTRAWRRYRNSDKTKIIKAVYKDIWGTADFPVQVADRDLEPFFESNSGAAQLRRWLLKTLMNISESNLSITTPPPLYVEWVKRKFVKLRQKYANENEMLTDLRPKLKDLEGQRAEQTLLSNYKGGSSKKDKGTTTPNSDKPKKTPAAGKRRRDMVNKTIHVESDEDEEDPVPKKSSGKKTKKDKSPKKTLKTKKTKKPSRVATEDDDIAKLKSSLISQNNNNATIPTPENPIEEELPARATINKPKALPPPSKKAVATKKNAPDDNVPFDFAFSVPSSPKVNKSAKKKVAEKEKEVKEAQASTDRVTRSASASVNNTNDKPKKRTARDASLSESTSTAAQKKKQKSTSP